MKPRISMKELKEKLFGKKLEVGEMGRFMEDAIKRVNKIGNVTMTDVPGTPFKAFSVDEQKPKPDNVKRFELLGAEKALLYARKNADYGDSFNRSLDEDGLLVAKIRLGDKYSRFCQLIKNPAQVTEEKLRETLIDLSNYADMTIMWLDALEEFNKKESMKKRDDSLDALAYGAVAAKDILPPGLDTDGDIYVDGIPIKYYTSSYQDKMNRPVPGLDRAIYLANGADMDGDTLPVLSKETLNQLEKKRKKAIKTLDKLEAKRARGEKLTDEEVGKIIKLRSDIRG